MAITEVNIRKEGRESFHTVEGRQYVVTYIVKSDSSDDTESAVYSHPSVPAVGDAYVNDVTTSCTNVNVSAVSGTRDTWIVRATFRRNKRLLPHYDWTFTPIREVITKDVFGNAIANSAETLFSPGLEKDLYVPTVKVTRSEQIASLGGTYNPESIAQKLGGVNTTYLTIDGYDAAPGEALLKDVTVSDPPDIIGNGRYYTVTYTVMFKKNDSEEASYQPSGGQFNAWNQLVIDAGMSYLDANDNDRRKTVVNEGDGTPSRQPKLLKDGHLAPAGEVYWRSFKLYPDVNLVDLNL